MGLGTWDEQWDYYARSVVHNGTYQAVPSHPMVHEDRMDSGISMLESRCFVGRTILYQPVLWYIRTGWTVGLTC